LTCSATTPSMSPSQARAAILGAVHAGAIGTFEAIAAQAGVPADVASHVMRQLRYGGRVVVVARQHNPERAGRPRAVYALHHQGHQALPVDVLAHARQCWR
jgi:predicted ArsR family transcriptional regulator